MVEVCAGSEVFAVRRDWRLQKHRGRRCGEGEVLAILNEIFMNEDYVLVNGCAYHDSNDRGVDIAG